METIIFNKKEAKELYWLLRHVQVCFHYYAKSDDGRHMYEKYSEQTIPFIEKLEKIAIH